MSDIDKRLEELAAELYAPTVEGRRCISLALALLRARKALTEVEKYRFYAQDCVELAHRALADPELEKLLR